MMTKQEMVSVPRIMWDRYRFLTIYAAVVATLELIILVFGWTG